MRTARTGSGQMRRRGICESLKSDGRCKESWICSPIGGNFVNVVTLIRGKYEFLGSIERPPPPDREGILVLPRRKNGLSGVIGKAFLRIYFYLNVT
jgi:hypothetical protein